MSNDWADRFLQAYMPAPAHRTPAHSPVSYAQQVAAAMNGTAREGGGDVQADGAPVMVLPPETIVPSNVRMTPKEAAQAQAFMTKAPTYGSGGAPTGTQLFDAPTKPKSDFFAVPNPVDDAAARGLVTIPRTGVSTDFHHDVQPGAEPMLAPPPAPPEQPRFALAPGSGAVMPAHEVERRGPSLIRAQQEQNAALGQAAHNIEARTEDAAAQEYAMARAQAATAQAREDAALQSNAERQQELQARQADFDASVKQLSQMSLDPDRFWASRSTPQKIGGLISIALGGFLQGAHGGPNPGLDIINTAIERDLEAQKFAYQAARDTAQAKQTAYSLALQKYGSSDAATAAARASALDAVEAQLRQQGAVYKGTDAGNRADMMAAQLADQKAQQIAQGIAFVPAAQAPAMFIDRNTGLPYTVAELKAMAGEDRAQQRAIEMEGLKGNTQLAIEGAKAEAQAGKDIRAEQVQLPNGEVVRARSATQANELAEASQALAETKRLVAQAKEIRSGESFRVPGSGDRARLDQVQKNLLTQYAVLHKLGAISKEDMNLAVGGTADLFAVGPGPEAALEGLTKTAAANLNQKVGTIPDASPRAKGEMPASFTAHGGK